jgi:hypothetical protein
MRTGKPILAVADRGALTDLLAATGGGLWADISDPKDIADKLVAALQLPTRSQDEVQALWGGQFHYRALAGKLAVQIQRVAAPTTSASLPWGEGRALPQPVAREDRQMPSSIRVQPRLEPQDATDNFIILRQFPGPELEQAWHAFLARAEFPSHYNSPAFFLEPYWAGKRPFAVLALELGRIVGVLTGVHEGDEGVTGLPSRPQICFDKTADRAAVSRLLISGFLQESSAEKVVTAYTWNWAPLDAFLDFHFLPRELEGNVVLELTKGPAALFSEFSPDRRRNIRFAIKQGVEVFQATTPEDLLAWYQVFAEWRNSARKKNEPPDQTFATFEQSFRLSSNRCIFLARFAGKIMAANEFRFYPGGLFESSSNCSLPEFLYLKPNDLLQWRGIEWACQQGLVRHSLGASHGFLRRFGGKVVPVTRYRLDRTWLHRHDLEEALFDAGRETLRKLPAPIEITVRKIFGKGHPRRQPEPAPPQLPEA